MIRFGVVADCQYAETDEVYLNRFLRLSKKKLEEAVETFRREPPLDFILNLGDLVDRGWENFASPLEILEGVPLPKIHVLGNHDFDCEERWKGGVARRLGLPACGYRRFEIADGWWLLVLNGNERSLFAYPEGSEAWEASRRFWESLPGIPETWNGGMGEHQLAWIREELNAARSSGQRVVVCCHFPIAPSAGRFRLWNADDLTRLIEDSGDVVAVYLCGHHHAGGSDLIGTVPHLNLVGMVDTEENAFSILEVGENAVSLRGFGRQPDGYWGIG